MNFTKLNISIVILLIFFGGCIPTQIKYDKQDIEKKYTKKNYTTTLNGKTVDFTNLYLDKENIESVTRNRLKKHINIEQKNRTDLVSLHSFESDSLSLDNISTLVINGIVLSMDEVEKIQIEPTALKSMQILDKASLNSTIFCNSPKGDLLLIVMQ